MSRTRLITTAAGIAALFVFAPAAQAVTCDGLDAALSSAGDGGVVTLNEGQECHGHFDLPDDTTITLQGGGTGATLDGHVTEGDLTTDVQILSGQNVGETVIRNLTFRNGDAGDGNGGAIDVSGDSPVTIEDNHFTSNQADRGGAVAAEIFSAIELAGRADGVSDVTLRNNTFADNTAFDRGGAAYLDAASPVDITGNDFTDNTSVNIGSSGESGGGIYVIADGEFTLVANTFSRNTATARGGGATARLCSGATVTGNTFDANQIVENPEDGVLLSRELRDGPLGAGLHLASQFCDRLALQSDGEFQVLQSGNSFTGNVIEAVDPRRPPGGGAGESVQDLSVQSTDDSFVRNEIHNPGGEGAGLAVETIGNQVFEGRNLVAAANAILAEPPTEAASSARALQPDGEGGGVYFGATLLGGELRLFDSTVVSNRAQNGSGIRGGSCDALILHNGIVHGNTGDETGEISGFNAGQQCGEQVPGGAARAAGDPGTRDVRFTDFCETGAQSAAGEGNICTDPLLVDPDAGNVHQIATSPTRDAGSDPLVPLDLANDYEGDGRKLGARVDMGADEFPEPAAVPTPAPPPAAVPAPPPAAVPAPQPQGAVLGVQQRSCVSRRAFRIRLRVPRGKKAVSATVRVNGKQVKVVRGGRLRSPVVLRGLPKGKVTVRITIRLKGGKRVTGTRVYNTCIPRLPGDGPPPV